MRDAQDVVAVFDESLNEMFEDARAMRALVHERSKIMEHPVEDGTTISDHVVDLPVEIELFVILTPATFADTYKTIKNAWQAKKTVTVQTKTDSYGSMLIFEIPHDEVPEMYDTVALGIKLREVVLVAAQYAQLPQSQVKKKSNSSTVKTGQKNPQDAGAKTSAAYDVIFGSGH